MVFFGHGASFLQFLVGRGNGIFTVGVSAVDGRAGVAINGTITWPVEIIIYSLREDAGEELGRGECKVIN